MPSADLQVTFIDGASWIWNTGLLTAWFDFEFGETWTVTNTLSGLDNNGNPIPYVQYIQQIFDRAGIAKWTCSPGGFTLPSGANYNGTSTIQAVYPSSVFGKWLGFSNGAAQAGFYYQQTVSPYVFADTVAGEQSCPIGLFSNQPFTIDFFINVPGYNLGTNTYYLVGGDDPSGQRCLEVFINTTGHLCAQFYSSAGVMTTITASGLVPLNVWNHVAYCRVGDTITLYLNGTSVGSASLAPGAYHNDGSFNTTGGNYLTASTSAIVIGYAQNDRTGYRSTCYWDDIVIVQGTSLYTGNFTPRTSPFNPLIEGAWGQLMPPPVYTLQPMTITGNTTYTWFSNQSNTARLAVLGGNGNYVNLSVISGSLPAGVIATLYAGVITIAGSPQSTQTFTLQVEDIVGSTPATATITINDAGTLSLLNPAATSTLGTLSGDSSTFTSATSSQWISSMGLTSKSIATANHYFEVNGLNSASGYYFASIGQAGMNYQTSYGGGDTLSYGWDSSGNVYHNASVIFINYGPGQSGGTIGVLIKNGKLYFRNTSGWMNGADPIGAETGFAVSGLTGLYFPVVSVYYNTSVQLATALSQFSLWDPTTQGSSSWAGA